MKKKPLIAKILIFSFIINIALPVFSEETTDTTPKPYDKKELPQGVKDLRRFEIITLGALPFVTLDTTLAYSTIRYAQHNFDNAYAPDIFSKSNFSQEEQKNIILTSVGICIGIGLTDYIVQLIRRNSKKRKARQITYDDIAIVPISEDPDATEIAVPDKNQSTEEAADMADEVQEIEE